MKALIKVVSGGGEALASVRYVLTLKGGKGVEMAGDLGARVGQVWVSHDLQGVDLKNHDEIAQRIEAPTRLWCSSNHGRHRDHFVLSSPSGASSEEFEALAPQMLEDLVKELEISTYLAVTHVDCLHPHVHVICDAYAPGVGRGQRRHFDKSALLDLDSMEWTRAFEAPTPDLGAEHSSRGKQILATKFKGAPEKKVDLCAELVRALGGKIEDVETMVKKLESIPDLPFSMNARKKCGKIKPSAVIESNGVKVRLDWLIKHENNLFRTKQFEELRLQEKEASQKPKTRSLKELLDKISSKEKEEKTAQLKSQLRRAKRNVKKRKKKGDGDDLPPL